MFGQMIWKEEKTRPSNIEGPVRMTHNPFKFFNPLAQHFFACLVHKLTKRQNPDVSLIDAISGLVVFANYNMAHPLNSRPLS